MRDPHVVSTHMKQLAALAGAALAGAEAGVKHDDDKTRPELLSPSFLLGVSDVLRYGAEKYEARNWEKGILYSRVYGALLRHLLAWWGGAERDPETGLHHLYHAGCCLMFLAHYEADPLVYTEWDDRP